MESPTRQLEMTAAKDINFQSRAGGTEISALKDVKLTALDGSVSMNCLLNFKSNCLLFMQKALHKSDKVFFVLKKKLKNIVLNRFVHWKIADEKDFEHINCAP